MVQREKWTTNAHVHVQGLTSLSVRTFENKRGELAKNHFSRKECPRSKPVQHVRRECTETGFQYMMKEGHPPLFQKGFTEEEIEELKVASEEHVRKMKTNMQEWVKEMEIEGHRFHNVDGFKRLFNEVALEVDKQLEAEGKKPTRYTTKDVAQGLRLHPKVTDEFRMWLLEHNKY